MKRRMNHPIIFVVDDDPSVLNAVQWLLESDGQRVMTYHSGERFLNALERDVGGFCFDEPSNACLVLDLKMPNMDGLELQRLLAKRCPCLSVIFVSGEANQEQAEQAMLAGAVAFLEKPLNDEILLGYIRQAIKR